MSPRGYGEKFYADARKFDSGGKANPILIPMLRASMEEVALINTVEAQKKLKELIAPLLEWVNKNDYIVSAGLHASHLIGIRPLNRTTDEMLEMCNALKSRGIYIAVRCGGFRISPYLSNTKRDIERLIQGLEELGNYR
jgi:selenocysteine lyase/cysteine desulfurase